MSIIIIIIITLFNAGYIKRRVHNRFGGTAGSAFFDGRDTGYTMPDWRDTGWPRAAGSGFEHLALRDTGLSIFLYGIRDLEDSYHSCWLHVTWLLEMLETF